MSSICFDVIGGILLCLFVKDLLRFRCVSKFFRFFIDSPDFTKQHLSHSQKSNTNLYGIFNEVQSGYHEFPLFDLNKSINDIYIEIVNGPLGFESAQSWEVVGSCNGLIALTNLNAIVFWNPFGRKSKKVISSMSNLQLYTYGFGYDPKTDDYKLVRNEVIHGNYGIAKSLRAAIYCLKTNSWKEVIGSDFSLNSPAYYTHYLKFGLLANNALLWRMDVGEYGLEIAAFDLVKEEFHYLPVLECFKFKHWMDFSVFDGCLTVTCRFRERICVWVMKEYGVKESWTEVMSYLYSETEGSFNVVPLAYSRNRDKILLSIKNHWYWYDLISKMFDLCLGKCYASKTFIGSLIALNDITDVVDLKRKQNVLAEYNNENEEKRKKSEINS